MKKIVLALATLAVALSGCNDEQVSQLTSQLQQKEQNLNQLNSDLAKATSENVHLKNEIAKLQDELKKNNAKESSFRPAISTKEDVIFKKSEDVKLTNKEALAEIDSFDEDEDYKARLKMTKVSSSVTTLETNLPWLNEILLAEVFSHYSYGGNKIDSREKLIAKLTKDYSDMVEEAKNMASAGLGNNTSVHFLGQKERFATFTAFDADYAGGAHGMYRTEYLVIDLDKKSVVSLNDLFSEKNQSKLRELLWESYKNANNNGDLSLIPKADFNPSYNFYFTENGISFIYGTYELGSYTNGEEEVRLSWEEVNPLLNKYYRYTGKRPEIF